MRALKAEAKMEAYQETQGLRQELAVYQAKMAAAKIMIQQGVRVGVAGPAGAATPGSSGVPFTPQPGPDFDDFFRSTTSTL